MHVNYLSKNPISKVVRIAKGNPWEEILPKIKYYQQTELNTDLWRPTITKVERKALHIQKRRTHTNQIWYNQQPNL